MVVVSHSLRMSHPSWLKALPKRAAGCDYNVDIGQFGRVDDAASAEIGQDAQSQSRQFVVPLLQQVGSRDNDQCGRHFWHVLQVPGTKPAILFGHDHRVGPRLFVRCNARPAKLAVVVGIVVWRQCVNQLRNVFGHTGSIVVVSDCDRFALLLQPTGACSMRGDECRRCQRLARAAIVAQKPAKQLAVRRSLADVE